MAGDASRNARRSYVGVAGVLAIAATLITSGCSTPDADADPREFFKNKTMTYVVPSAPGGGYDAYARLITPFLERHLGLSRVLVRNAQSSGHIVGANDIYAARPDGLTIGSFSAGIIYAQLLGLDTLRADLTRMSWIGQPSEEPLLLTVSARSGLRSLDDAIAARRPVLFGASDRGSKIYFDSVLLAHALGLQARVVFGLNTSGAHLSMLRGEIDARVSSASSARTLLADGDGHAIVRVGLGENLETHARVPEAGDVVDTDDARRLLDFVRALTVFSHWTVGPPGIPADRLEVLREAYVHVLNDPALVAMADRMQLPVTPVRDGERLARDVRRALDQPLDVVDMIAIAARGGAP